MLQVCKFLEVSKLSFSPEYGPKLKEEYVMVKHLPKILKDEDSRKCCLSDCFSCCNDNWQKVKNPAFGYALLILLFKYFFGNFYYIWFNFTLLLPCIFMYRYGLY